MLYTEYLNMYHFYSKIVLNRINHWVIKLLYKIDFCAKENKGNKWSYHGFYYFPKKSLKK